MRSRLAIDPLMSVDFIWFILMVLIWFITSKNSYKSYRCIGTRGVTIAPFVRFCTSPDFHCARCASDFFYCVFS